MTVLITGATGLIGGALARTLAADGHAVRALVRAGADTSGLDTAGVERAEGDIRDAAAVRAAMRGCTHVVHLAAQRTQRGIPLAVYHAVNVDGTRNVAAAAAAEGVSRVVYGSTLGVHGFVTRSPVDEATPVRPNTPYRLTKWLGEEALHAAGRDGLPVVVARIASVLGPGAALLLPFCRLIDAGRLRLIGGGANAIDVVVLADLVAGLGLALTAPGADGRTYVLGGDQDVTLRDVAALVAGALGRPVPRRGLPAAPYRLLVHASDLTFRATGRIVPFAHRREALVADKAASIARARADLGYAPAGDLGAAVRAMVAAFRATGGLPSGEDRQ